MTSTNLTLRIHRMRIDAMKRSGAYSRLGVEDTTSPPHINKDDDVVAFAKKVGGQYSQFYKLKKFDGLDKEEDEDIFIELPDNLPLEAMDSIRSSIVDVVVVHDPKNYWLGGGYWDSEGNIRP